MGQVLVQIASNGKPSHCSDVSPASCDSGFCFAQEGKHWEAFLATHGEVSAEAEETPMKAQQPTGAQVAAHQQVSPLTHRWYPLPVTQLVSILLNVQKYLCKLQKHSGHKSLLYLKPALHYKHACNHMHKLLCGHVVVLAQICCARALFDYLLMASKFGRWLQRLRTVMRTVCA